MTRRGRLRWLGRATAAAGLAGALVACTSATTSGHPQPASGGSIAVKAVPVLGTGGPVGPSSGAAGSSPAPRAPAATPTPPPAAAVRRRPRPINHCAHNAGGKLVLVSITAQHAWMCAGRRAAYSTAVTSGAVGLPYDATPLGNFEIQGRDRNTVLTLNTGATYHVKYWIPFSAPLFGFHDASWQKMPFGSPGYRTHGSHGCVHMPLAAMKFLYNWGAIGTPVHIRRR
jgi:lipoprotein-anchoring transpeptidase ErfK/SrfK